MNENDLIERQLDSRLIFDGRILHVYDDAVTLPNGGVASRELIRHIGAVCVIPVLRDGRAVVERQYRYPVGEVLTEIPAGKLDAPDEDPEQAARRELREETGYTCDELIALGVFYPAPAYSSEKIHMYLARGLHRGDQELDEDEFLNVTLFPLEDLAHQALNGEIPDIKTQAAVLRAWTMLTPGKEKRAKSAKKERPQAAGVQLPSP